jgi:serralysin
MATKKRAGPPRSDAGPIRMCTDVFPPPGQEDYFADLARQEDPANGIPGLAQAFGCGSVLPQRIAIITGKKWANGRTLKVAFMGGSGSQQEFVARTAAKWSLYANIGFQWGVPAASSDLRITFDARSGAWSYTGTDCLGIPKSQATMNLGWLDEAVVLHEFGHSLAAIHEHQHPQGGIPWNREAVYRYYSGPPNNWDRATIDSNLFGTYSVSQTQFSAYDPKSIMHYAIDARLLTDPGKAVGWNGVLSGSDMAYIGQVYPKAVTPPPEAGWTITIKGTGPKPVVVTN